VYTQVDTALISKKGTKINATFFLKSVIAMYKVLAGCANFASLN
jgi:hypothetical protein